MKISRLLLDMPIRELLAIVFFAALAVRILNVLVLPISFDAVLAEDAAIYWDSAGVLLEHGVFGRIIDGVGIVSETERMPGYAVFLAGLRWLFSDALLGILLAQAVLDSLTCVLIAVIGAQFSRSLALVSGFLAVFWVNLIIHSAMILSDSLFMFLIVVMLLGATRFLRYGKIGALALAGMSLGLAIATRNVAQLLPFLMLPAAPIVPLYHQRGVRVAAASVALFLFLSLLPVSPLVYRNYTEFGTLALTSQAGTHLAGWVVPLVRRAADGTPRGKGAFELVTTIQQRLVSENLVSADASEFERSAAFQRLALKELAEYPVSSVVKAWFTGGVINLAAPAISVDHRIRHLPHASFDSTEGNGLAAQISNMLSKSSTIYIVAMVGGLLFALIFSGVQFYGFLCLARLSPWAALFSCLCLCYFLIINGPVGSPKYRLPFEPVLILFSALAFLDLFYRLRRS